MNQPAASVYLDTNELPWRETPHAGVQWKKLRYDKESGASTVLLRFEPGAEYGAHRHPDGEQYLVLEGSLEEGNRSYGAGTWVWHPPGSAHRPRSAEGALILVILPRPIDPIQ